MGNPIVTDAYTSDPAVLVHDGTVWSEDGALPTFVHADEDDGDPTRTAARHVADGVHAAPPIPLPQPDESVRADLLHVLALRGRPDRVGGGAWLPVGDLAVHFHDTYGQALANTLVALQRGITTVDASAGGLGGCPYAGSATGNLATEDLVWQLHGLGIETGVDLDALVRTSAWMAERLGRPSPSRTLTALLPSLET